MVLSANNQSSFFTRHRWLVLTLGILVAVIVLASFVSMRDEVVLVRAAKVERGTMRNVISTNGKIEPIQNFEAHSPVNTTVRKILVKEGQHVKKGQLLLQLDDADARSQAARAQAQMKAAQASVQDVTRGGSQEELLTLQAQLVKARTDRDAAQRSLDAMRRLQQKGAASQGEVKEAENNLQRAEADLNLLEEKQKERYSKTEVERVEAQKSEAGAAYSAAEDVLQKSNVIAAFDGVVYSLPVKQGSYVQAGELLLQEADLSKVLVRSYVDEPDIGRLATGQKTEVTWDAVPGRVWKGSITSVPSVVKKLGTRNIGETTAVLDNNDYKLLPNTNVSVTIVLAEQQNALLIPREALRQDQSTPYVYQIVDDTLRRHEVHVASSNLTSIEVSGLSDNDVVALSPINPVKTLRDGTPVKVVQ
ncbi:MAG TPA: efflux RND transporter periplasmic adaptor subunit [Terriglobales bacterium]|nr:efflux RND transporter periplasmic adaptor subunit [Terriglobales bacterium]